MLVYKRLPLLIISIGGQPTVDSLVARQLHLGCVRKHEPVSKPVSSVLPRFLPQAPALSFSQWRVVFKVPVFPWDDFDQNVLSWRQKSKLEPTSNATTPCFIETEIETERQVCAHVLYVMVFTATLLIIQLMGYPLPLCMLLLMQTRTSGHGLEPVHNLGAIRSTYER